MAVSKYVFIHTKTTELTYNPLVAMPDLYEVL